MGLDQYLKGEIYISQDRYKDGTHSDNPEYKIISSLFGLKDLVSKDSHTGIEITFPVGYWRKANQIHNWFVQNIQNGNDNCGNYYVSRENLETLKGLCVEVLSKKDYDTAKELLPNGEGFFFGGTGFDEWYFESVEKTIEILSRCLEMPAEISFEYQSSW